MAQIVIEVNNSDVGKFKDNDLLAYNEETKKFYRVTPEKFFADYNKMLTDLLARYDKQIADLIVENDTYKADYANLKKELTKFTDELTEKNRKINSKLIEMVETFIKSGGSK